ncbi:MAG: hypothetical protein NC177_15780 [Ruminococcus flavefaciens]|nr:hypothetical protein [Ruminococcus flavefaciens]
MNKNNNKIFINTTLFRKVSDFRTNPHVVEKAFPLSVDEFDYLKNNLFSDNELIAKNKDLMYFDNNNICRCLLFYYKYNGDGILVESMENAEKITEKFGDISM